MPFFPSLPPESGIGHLWSLNPDLKSAMHELGRVIMRGPSPLTAGERELIAAYVSALNRCAYCYNGHAQMAVNLGFEPDVVEKLVEDIAQAPIRPELKPIFSYVRKLTLTPYAITQADAESVFAAGWAERALHDAILVCCRFNFMNRLSLGHGLDPDAVDSGERAAKMGYSRAD